MEARLATLEKRLEGGKKDRWDKFSIFASLLIPAAIALTGYWFSQATSRAQLASADRLAEASRAVQMIDARVKQAELVGAFLEPLLSSDPSRKRLAIRAVLIALPEDGPTLVAEISRSDPSPEVQEFATRQLSDRREQLIANLFAPEAPVRIAAADEILNGWRSDAEVVSQLVAYARRHAANSSGVYNAVAVLAEMDVQALAARRGLVIEFLREAEANGERTKTLSQRLQRQLG